MTTLFYAPPDAVDAGRVVLPEGESRHAVKVLRMREGDDVVVVDGAGGWYRGRLAEAHPERAVVAVDETRQGVGEPARTVVLALGLLHHRDRFETAVEKAVELGASGVIPLRTSRAAPGSVRAARLETILLAGMKQSMRSVLPRLYDEHTLAEALSRFEGAQVLMAHEAAEEAPMPSAALGPGDGPVVVLVGPEGGFSPQEVEVAQAAGARLVSLGPRRLRAETAAMVALADLMLHLP